MNDEVKMISIEQIRIVNHRHRDPKRFAAIVQNIKNVGLKNADSNQSAASNRKRRVRIRFDLWSRTAGSLHRAGAQGIPAIVVEISREELLLRSLVENIARRYPQPMDLFVKSNG